MKTLRIACTAVPTSIDRDQFEGLFQVENVDCHVQLYEALATYSGARPATAGGPQSLELGPLVAEQWKRLDDGKRYRCRLKQGIFSALGNELTAEDVFWTWKRSLALGTVGAWIASNAGITSAEQVQVVDRYTVEFRLPDPTTILPHLLSVPVPTVFDSREAQAHATDGDPWALDFLGKVGAGFSAYVVDPTSSNGHFRLAKNPNYWQHPLYYDEVEYVALPDPAERLHALVRGDVDAAIDLRIRDADFPGVVVHHVPLTFQTKLGLNCSRPPFDLLAVRRAVAKAIPYERIIDEAFQGNAKRMRGCIADILVGYVPVHPSWEFRPDEARVELEPLLPLPSVQLAYRDIFPFPAIAEIVGQGLEEVGLEVELLPLSTSEHTARKGRRELDLFLDFDGPITIDARYALGHDFNPPPGGVFDFTGYHNEEIGGLLRASLVELDSRCLGDLLADVQRIACHDVPWIPLVQNLFSFGLRESIAGYRWYPGIPRLRARDLYESTS